MHERVETWGMLKMPFLASTMNGQSHYFTQNNMETNHKETIYNVNNEKLKKRNTKKGTAKTCW